VLPDYGDVVRLYDYFLAQPPLMPIYLAAAIVLYRKEDILTSGGSAYPPPHIKQYYRMKKCCGILNFLFCIHI
jgi:hypothetical protein